MPVLVHFRECTFEDRSDEGECEALRAGVEKEVSANYGVCYSFNYFPPWRGSEDLLVTSLSGENVKVSKIGNSLYNNKLE